jgi:hypothetical protein
LATYLGVSKLLSPNHSTLRTTPGTRQRKADAVFRINGGIAMRYAIVLIAVISLALQLVAGVAYAESSVCESLTSLSQSLETSATPRGKSLPAREENRKPESTPKIIEKYHLLPYFEYPWQAAGNWC